VYEPLHIGNAETEAHRKMIQFLPHLFLLPEGAVLGKMFLDDVRPQVDECIRVPWRVLDDFPAAVALAQPCTRNQGGCQRGCRKCAQTWSEADVQYASCLYRTCARVKPTIDLLPQAEVLWPQDAHNAPKPREGHKDEANLEAKLFWVLEAPHVVGQPARHAHTRTRTRTYTHMHVNAGLRVAYTRQTNTSAAPRDGGTCSGMVPVE
jgi:hypothetical protein